MVTGRWPRRDTSGAFSIAERTLQRRHFVHQHLEKKCPMFKPLHGNHSIQSVLIRATGGGPMMESDRPNLQRGYVNRWKAVLPAKQESQQIQITLGVGARVSGSDSPEPLAPTMYVEYTSSGEAAWWMEVGHNMITIGTTIYTNWLDIWRKATGLLEHVGKTLGSEHPMGKILTLELTYEDVFMWDDDSASDTYTPEQVIKEDSIPDQAKGSKEWHSGQGWVVDPSGERTLERFQISGVMAQSEDEESRPAIVIHTTATRGFGGSKPIFELAKCSRKLHAINSGRVASAHNIGNDIHDRTKQMLHRLLTPRMSQDIGLVDVK